MESMRQSEYRKMDELKNHQQKLAVELKSKEDMVQKIKDESQKQKEMQLIEFEVQTKNKVDVAEVEKLQQNLSKVQ